MIDIVSRKSQQPFKLLLFIFVAIAPSSGRKCQRPIYQMRIERALDKTMHLLCYNDTMKVALERSLQLNVKCKRDLLLPNIYFLTHIDIKNSLERPWFSIKLNINALFYIRIYSIYEIECVTLTHGINT